MGLPGCSCAPRQRPGRDGGVWLSQGWRPPRGMRRARVRGDRDDAGGLAPLRAQVLPALVEAALGAPGDLDDARVLPGLAARERLADAWLVAVVVGGLDQQPAGVGGPGLGDRALAALGVRGVLGGHDPEEARTAALGLGKRAKSPTSAHSPAAVSVSIPRKQRSRAITGGVRALGDLLLERRDQRRAAAGQQLDRGQVVSERRLRAGVIEAQRAQPAQVLGRPGAARSGVALAAAQQELRRDGGGRASDRRGRPRSRAPGHGSCSSSTLGTNAKRQLAGRQQPRQAGRVATVGLDAVTRALRDRPRRHDLHVDPALPRRARQPEPGRARPHTPRAPQAPDPPGTTPPPPAPPAACSPQLAGIRVEHRRVRLPRVHVQTDKAS